MSEKVQVNNSLAGLTGVIGVVFVALKIAGVISWPWLAVLAPFWIPILFICIVLGGVAVVAGIAFLLAAVLTWFSNRRGK